MLLVLLSVMVGLVANDIVQTQPEHVHLSYGGTFQIIKAMVLISAKVGYTQMMITWSSTEETRTSTVEYGLGQFDFNLTETGTSTLFRKGGERAAYIHRVMLKNLKPNTVYCE